MENFVKECLNIVFDSINNNFMMEKRRIMSNNFENEYKKNNVTSYKGCSYIESNNECRCGPPLMIKMLYKYVGFNVLFKEF